MFWVWISLLGCLRLKRIGLLSVPLPPMLSVTCVSLGLKILREKFLKQF